MDIARQTVFVLQHGKGKDADEDLKFIGVFASREAANSAIRHLKKQRGFCTKEGRFSLDEYTLDQMHWSTGYISRAEASIPVGEPLPIYHVHVYYDIDRRDDAQRLCERMRDSNDLIMGRMHDAPVGPHPRGSCQLTVPLEKFWGMITWLLENRDGLTIFAHLVTGDEFKDLTEHVLWLGPSEPLDLSVL